jgi:hypothetical protein
MPEQFGGRWTTVPPAPIITIIPSRFLFSSSYVAKNPHAAKKRGKFA